jgi:hypothetical protein
MGRGKKPTNTRQVTALSVDVQPKRGLSEETQLVFSHLASRHERESRGMTVADLAACRQTPAAIEAALVELYGHQLARETAGVWTLTARGASCTGSLYKRAEERANALVIEEGQIANEIDGELLTVLLAENAPERYATALLVDEGKVTASEREYQLLDVQSWALNWFSADKPGRIIVIERRYPEDDLQVQEFDRQSREWLPLRAVSAAVNHLRRRPSALAEA